MIAYSGRFALGYLFLTEFMPEKYESWVGSGMLRLETAMTIYLTIYYRYISKDLMPLSYTGLALNLISNLLMLAWVPESVRWLVSVREFELAKQGISKWPNLMELLSRK